RRSKQSGWRASVPIISRCWWSSASYLARENRKRCKLPFARSTDPALRRHCRRRLSHVLVDRPFTPLGRDPVDVLVRVLDVTGLAVHAVLRIDDEARIGTL